MPGAVTSAHAFAYPPAVLRALLATTALVAPWGLATACTRPGAVELPVDGVRSLLVVRAALPTGAPASVAVLSPEELERAPWLQWSEDTRVVLLGYDRPLSVLGLRLAADGSLRTAARGVPLPPPTVASELVGGESLVPFTEDPGTAFPELRVPDAPCVTLVEDRDERLVPDPGRELAFAAALDATRTLMVYEFKPPTSGAPGAALVTTTGSVALDWPISTALPGPRGFVEPDGRAWITLMLYTETTTVPALCTVDARGPLDARACQPARGDTSGFPFEALAGWRSTTDDMLELVAVNNDGDLYAWRGRTPSEGTWTRHSRGRIDTTLACEGLPMVTLSMDGPGTGVVATPRSELGRFHLDTPDRTAIFQGGSCRTAYARHPSGAQVIIRNESIAVTVGPTPESDVYVRRADDAPWTRVEGDTDLDARRVLLLDDVLLATAAANTLRAVVFEPGRPDVLPRVCGAVPVWNSGTWSSVAADGRVVVAGRVPEVGGLGTRAVGRWRLVPD